MIGSTLFKSFLSISDSFLYTSQLSLSHPSYSVKMTEQNKEENEHLSSSMSSNDLLTTIYDITRAIFRHLPIRSVDSCSLVCQSWAHLAHLTKTNRHTVHTLTYPSISSSSTTDYSLLLSDFDSFISPFMNNDLWSIPCLAFVVVTKDFEAKGFCSLSSSQPPTKVLKRSCSQSTSKRTEHVDISDALLGHLNKSCQLVTISSYGIIASNNENQSNEIESGFYQIYSSLFFFFNSYLFR